MNKGKLLTLIIAGLLISVINVHAKDSGRSIYQIKIYLLKNKTQENQVDNYLRKAYIPALHRLGIEHVGVFKPVGNDTAAQRKIYVLSPFHNMDEFSHLQQKLQDDEQYLSDGEDYIDASYKNPPYERIQSIILRAFPESPNINLPSLSNPPLKRIYELRSYESPTEKLHRNKVHMFNYAPEISIFNQLDFNVVFYGHVLSGPSMPNLMYMPTFEDMATRDKLWDEFGNDPKWKQISSMDKYQHNVSKVNHWYLHPTEYSDI